MASYFLYNVCVFLIRVNLQNELSVCKSEAAFTQYRKPRYKPLRMNHSGTHHVTGLFALKVSTANNAAISLSSVTMREEEVRRISDEVERVTRWGR
jgi:hypothetical protein